MSELKNLLPWGPNRSSGDAASEVAHLQNCGYLQCENLAFLRVSGPDAASFMQGILTADVRGLALGRTRESWALDAQGKILFHALIFRAEATTYLLETTDAPALKTHLDKYLIMEDAALSLAPELACVTLQGKAARERAEALAGEGVSLLEMDRCGLGGVDLVCPRDRMDDLLTRLKQGSIPAIGGAALDLSRTEHFLPMFGREMEVGNNPLFYGKGGDRISYTKGCFLGQETVARTRDRGQPPKRLVLLSAEGDQPPEQGLALEANGKSAGAVCSAVADGRGKLLAFALIKHALAEEKAELTDGQGCSWHIIRVSDYKSD